MKNLAAAVVVIAIIATSVAIAPASSSAIESPVFVPVQSPALVSQAKPKVQCSVDACKCGECKCPADAKSCEKQQSAPVCRDGSCGQRRGLFSRFFR